MPDQCEPGQGRPLNYSPFGWAETQDFRLRTGWFGFAVLEQRFERDDGSCEWRRRPSWRRAIAIREYKAAQVLEFNKPLTASEVEEIKRKWVETHRSV